MKALEKIIATALREDLNPRYRDRRAHYASDAFRCKRDLYWSYTGEQATDKTDFHGQMRMAIGKAIEEILLINWIRNAHHEGLHFIATQVSVGGANKIDGLLDALVYEVVAGAKDVYVIECKSKSGMGADMLANSFDVGKEYLATQGIYLKDLAAKGTTNHGCFIFFLLSDKNMGNMLQISYRYEAATDEIVVYEGRSSNGDVRELNQRLKVSEAEQWFKDVEGAVKAKQVPSPSYKYKHELTPVFLAAQSDYALKAAIAGEKILGDWQPRYSRYFTKGLEVDKTAREYTPAEISLLLKEYNNRLTPTGRKRKPLSVAG